MGKDKIEKLLFALPKKDKKRAEELLAIMDIDTLKELVDSALIKIKINLRKENPKEEYLAVDLDKLENLKAEVDLYYDGFLITSEDDLGGFYD